MMQGPRFRMIRSKAFGDLSELKDETEFKIDYRIPFKIDYKIDLKSSEEVSSEEDAEDVSSVGKRFSDPASGGSCSEDD